jgi:prevent-host-death family protein
MMARSKGAQKIMQIVNIAELKNNLSHYLRQVRQGNEITIKDRNRVIARIVPAAPAADYDEELLELAAQGKVKLPELPPDPDLWRTVKPAKLKTKGKAASDLLRRIMDEERGKY